MNKRMWFSTMTVIECITIVLLGGAILNHTMAGGVAEKGITRNSTIPQKNLHGEFTATDSILGVAEATKIVTDSVAVPDTVVAIDHADYFAVVTGASTIAMGLYYVDISERRIEMAVGGSPKIIASGSQKNGFRWILVSSMGLRSGIGTEEYTAFIISSHGAGKKHYTKQYLFGLLEDGESGACGDNSRAAAIGLKAASVLDTLTVTGSDLDGVADISFAITTTDCLSGTTSQKIDEYLFVDGKFVKK